MSPQLAHNRRIRFYDKNYNAPIATAFMHVFT